MNQLLAWILFNVFVVLMLVLDLKVFHRTAHEVKIKEALFWTAFWVSLALLFCCGIYYFEGSEAALKFLAGFLIEKSLSVDNLFVFLVLFSYFKVPAQMQHRVLFWGIVGALVMRAFFILAGVSLIHKFHWMVYIFGVFLIVTAMKLIFSKDKEVEPEKNPLLKLVRRILPITEGYEGDRFFVLRNKQLYATPLFVVLLVIESTDVVFAVDSIPAILSITTDAFIVYTSNIFAILGLRALYFALAGLMGLFRFLNYGLGFILAFVGVKMLVSDVVKIPIGVALGVIACILGLSIAASVLWPEKSGGEAGSGSAHGH